MRRRRQWRRHIIKCPGLGWHYVVLVVLSVERTDVAASMDYDGCVWSLMGAETMSGNPWDSCRDLFQSSGREQGGIIAGIQKTLPERAGRS